MGWARTLLLGDIGNRLDIGDVEETVRALRRQVRQLASHQSHDLEELRAENESLKLYLAALTRLEQILAERGLDARIDGALRLVPGKRAIFHGELAGQL